MILNVAHYVFVDIPDPEAARLEAETFLSAYAPRVAGTVLIAHEGVNFNVAGPSEDRAWVGEITAWLKKLGANDFRFRLSESDALPFKRLKVRVRPEIVTMGMPDLNVAQWTSPAVSPEEFAKVLESPGDALILDTRNEFEVEMGTFKGAQSAGMTSFRDFPRIAAELPRDKPIYMFCTGGIRCEKASAYLRREGFDFVRQLDGGILRYFERLGGQSFKGQCFVFDERRSLDGDTLSPGE